MDDYFKNHGRVRQFPWSLYHGPLERDLDAFLRAVGDVSPRAKVLVLGCGTMAELDAVPATFRVSVADIDARAVAAVAARRDPRIVSTYVLAEDGDLSALPDDFDAIYAKEVIEHVVPWQQQLLRMRSKLRPGGKIWLSTPNYGEPWLPLIEHTFLEVVARIGGFTRRGMHPSKFSRHKLHRGLEQAGFARVKARPIALRLALVARGTAP